MNDLISRQAAIDAVNDTIAQYVPYLTRETNGIPLEVALAIKRLPSTQSERKKGKWIKTGQSFVFSEKFRNYSCSECGYDFDKIKFNFCPNCGADMRPKLVGKHADVTIIDEACMKGVDDETN